MGVNGKVSNRLCADSCGVCTTGHQPVNPLALFTVWYIGLVPANAAGMLCCGRPIMTGPIDCIGGHDARTLAWAAGDADARISGGRFESVPASRSRSRSNADV